MRTKPVGIRITLAVLAITAGACGTNDDPDDGAVDRANDATTTTIATGTPAAIPLGDGKYSDEPQAGYVFTCRAGFGGGGGGAQAAGPWINQAASTWTPTEKIAVKGDVDWGAELDIDATASATHVSGNGLPVTPTGTFPVAASDPAYQYDRNPNTIKPYELDVELPASPTVGATPTCVGGTIGVSVLGAPIYSAFDAMGRDAAAHEVQDACDGHPERTGQYHFHSLSDCLGGDDDEDAATRDDGLFGYALDGFGIYVERDANGKLLTTADLDECHGRTSVISWRGEKVSMYHYVATADFPYLVGCYRGTPITTATGLSIGPAR